MSQQDYYSVLGVQSSATDPEIKKAYLNLAKKYHPDRNNGDLQSEKKFKEISSAYEVLKDSQKRSAYDQFGHDAFNGSGGASHGQGGFRHTSAQDINDIFGEFFSDARGSGRNSARSSKVRGSDLKYNLSIKLEEAFTGLDKEIHFSTEAKCVPCNGMGTKDANASTNCKHCKGSGTLHMQHGFFAVEQTCNYCNGVGHIIRNPCHTCNGNGRAAKQKSLVINIPSGIENNTRIRIAGEGEAGTRGGASGDLYVFINVINHEIYKVQGHDLHCKLSIPFTKAALGGEVEVPVVDGSKSILKIPPGVNTGDKLRLKNKGMTRVRSSSKGDLYTHIYIETPKKLTSKQKDLLLELDKEIGDPNIGGNDEGFFSKGLFGNLWK